MNNERMMMEGKLSVLRHDLREAGLSAAASRDLTREKLNPYEPDIVDGCDTAIALLELKRLHELREKIISLRAQIAKLEEALGHEKTGA
ncbi:MAG: hypothetical protein WC421_02850 [Elusimicrobiales bacterium]